MIVSRTVVFKAFRECRNRRHCQVQTVLQQGFLFYWSDEGVECVLTNVKRKKKSVWERRLHILGLDRDERDARPVG